MRKTLTGLAAVVAVMTVSAAAPAMACGGYSTGCGGGYHGPYSYGYTGYPTGYTSSRHAGHHAQTQYYYVNQGPTYTGPGTWAPYPTYQERAVSGSSAYTQPYYYGYNGGPYANTSHHYYDGAVATGPQIIRYQPRRIYRAAYHAPRVHVRTLRPHWHHRPVLRRYN